MMITISRLYVTMAHAREAIHQLKEAGFPSERISLMMRNSSDEPAAHAPVHESDPVGEGATTGVVAGAGLGALVGLSLAGSAILIPGIGPFVIGGPLAATLAGAGFGGASGGLFGALIGSGLSEEEAASYVEPLGEGAILVSVETEPDQAARAREILDGVAKVIV
jgi:hypothetical protein